jgi:hypothetical protein
LKHRVTDKEREHIRMFSTVGMMQKNVAAEVGLCRATVSKVQKQLGLNPHSTEPLSPAFEKKILDLFREGHGAPFIAKKLDLPQHRVADVMHKFSLRQQPGKTGCRYFVSAKKKRVIRRMFRTFEKRIARQFGVSEEWVEKFWRRRK